MTDEELRTLERNAEAAMPTFHAIRDWIKQGVSPFRATTATSVCMLIRVEVPREVLLWVEAAGIRPELAGLMLVDPAGFPPDSEIPIHGGATIGFVAGKACLFGTGQ